MAPVGTVQPERSLQAHPIQSSRGNPCRAQAVASSTPSIGRNERDGWVCGLCLQPVDSDLAWWDPVSSSVDHVVPLLLKETALRVNFQLAHRICNVRKGARLTDVAAAA